MLALRVEAEGRKLQAPVHVGWTESKPRGTQFSKKYRRQNVQNVDKHGDKTNFDKLRLAAQSFPYDITTNLSLIRKLVKGEKWPLHDKLF